ncbi:MAG: hypothetical protein O2970_11900, partial [Proteobacteria bacterium]|nr:hypothetical protein [Pseudomonadota bacterium]
SLYKYTWIFSAVFFVLSAILLALGNIIPQFFAFLFIFSTAISFISIFIVNAVILTKFRNKKRYVGFYKRIYPTNNNLSIRHHNTCINDKYIDTVNDSAYSSMHGNIYYSGDK